MTTPPNEPEQPHPGRPIGMYDMPEPIIPVAPLRESGAGLKIVLALTAFMVLLGGTIFWLSTKDTIDFGGSGHDPARPPVAQRTTAPPTSTSKPAPIAPFAEIGDCVKMTGNAPQPTYERLPCAENRHNYTVSKVASSSSDKCGAPADGYVQYSRISVLETVSVCLIPVFADGQCYDFTMADLKAEIPKAECGAKSRVFRATVLANTVDKAACRVNQPLALAYPEIKTTYCFTQP